MSQTVENAVYMLDILTRLGEGERITASGLRTELIRRGGDPEYVQAAAKFLRDRGIPVATEKARHNSTWYIAGDRATFEVYQDRLVAEMFSEAVSTARATGRLGLGRKVNTKATTTAVVLGERIGRPPSEVVELCKPLSMP